MSSDNIIILSDEDEEQERGTATTQVIPNVVTKFAIVQPLDFNKIALLSTLKLQPVFVLNSKSKVENAVALTNKVKNKNKQSNIKSGSVIKQPVASKTRKRKRINENNYCINGSDQINKNIKPIPVPNLQADSDTCIILSDDEEKKIDFNNKPIDPDLMSIKKTANKEDISSEFLGSDCVSLNSLEHLKFEDDIIENVQKTESTVNPDTLVKADISLVDNNKTCTETPSKKLKLDSVSDLVTNTSITITLLDSKETTSNDEILPALVDNDKRLQETPGKKITLTPVSKLETSICITLSEDEDESLSNKIRPTVLEKIENPAKSKPTSISNLETNICIVLSDDEQTDLNNKVEKDQIDKENLLDIVRIEENSLASSNKAGCSTEPSYLLDCQILQDCKAKLHDFVQLCLTKIQTKYKHALQAKIEVAKTLFNRLDNISQKYITEIVAFIEDKTILINNDNGQVVKSFKDLFLLLKLIYKESSVDKETRKKIKKLEKVLAKIKARIRRLEIMEVNFEDEDDSTYIQVQRYRDRAVKIFKKMCELQHINPNENRITHSKLDLQISKYDLINKAINKKYRNNGTFPTYYEMDKYIRKCVDKHQVEITETDLQYEIKNCFEALGKKLKKRRQKELFEVHKDYINDLEGDPLAADEESLKMLQKHKEEADKKMQELFHVFVVKQEKGEDPEVSADSEDNYSKSDKSDVEN